MLGWLGGLALHYLFLIGLLLPCVGGSILAVNQGSRRANGTAGFDVATKGALACFAGSIALFVVAVATHGKHLTFGEQQSN